MGKYINIKLGLVNNGFTHKKGINYFDTYSPVFGIITIITWTYLRVNLSLFNPLIKINARYDKIKCIYSKISYIQLDRK